jgi:hypothetical protein
MTLFLADKPMTYVNSFRYRSLSLKSPFQEELFHPSCISSSDPVHGATEDRLS